MHRARLFCLAAILIALSLLAAVSGRAEEPFAPVASGTMQNLWGVAYGSGHYIAVGDGGTVLRSPDGTTWATVASGTDRWLLSVTYGHDQWIIVGDDGIVLTSPDGTAWTRANSPISNRINAVVPYPGGYFAVGEGGRTLQSSDGVNWEQRHTIGGVSPQWLRGLVYASGYFTFSGNQGGLYSLAQNGMPSPKFDLAEKGVRTSSPIEGVAYGHDTYVAVGHDGMIESSSATTTWHRRVSPSNASFRAAAFIDHTFYAVGGQGAVIRSADGVDWKALAPATSADLLALTDGKNGVVAVGTGGAILHRPPSSAPPTITTNPRAQTEAIGGRVVFRVTATGPGPFTYVWTKDGNVLPGQTGHLLPVFVQSADAAGSYAVTVDNAWGSAVSNAAQLTVLSDGFPEPVYLDPTFDSSRTISRNGAQYLVQQDDRILIAFNASHPPGLTRLLANGEPDPSFDIGADSGSTAGVTAMAELPDGRLLIGGNFQEWNGQPAPGLVRLMPDGQRDVSFTPFGDTGVLFSGQLLALPDGEVLAGARYSDQLYRLDRGGRPVSGFDLPDDLQAITPSPLGGFWAAQKNDIDGQIPAYATVAVTRLRDDGSIDESVPRRTFRCHRMLAMRPQSDGTVVVYYSSPLPTVGTQRYRVERWNRDGSIDHSFAPYEYDVEYAGPSSDLVISPDGETYSFVRAISGLRDQLVQVDRQGNIIRRVDPAGSYGPRLITALQSQCDGHIVFSSFPITGYHSIKRLALDPGPLPQPARVWTIIPDRQTIDDGARYALSAIVSGSAPLTLGHQWENGNSVLDRASVDTTADLAHQGVHRITASSAVEPLEGPARPIEAWIDVKRTPLAFTTNLTNRTFRRGRQVSLSVTVTGSGPVVYNWYRNGTLIQNVNTSSLPIDTGDLDAAGRYQVIVNGQAGEQLVSSEAFISIGPAAYIKNLSTRARVGEANENLIVGFVLSGQSTSPDSILLRGIGPTLASFGVPDTLPHPYLNLFRSGGDYPVGTGSPIGTILRDAAIDFGAFPLAIGSGDTGNVSPRSAGIYSATLSNSPQFVSGNGLVEIYHRGQSAPWLTNVSSRARVGTGDDLMIAGLVIEGAGTYPYLIRGIGPALATYGVTDTLADPVLEIINTATGETVATNNDWDPARADDFAAAGAFPLTAGSKDAAIRVNLPPGRYTALLSGINNTTGVGLIEIYELP